MIRKDVEDSRQIGELCRLSPAIQPPPAIRSLALCVLGFVLCILVSVAPLHNLAGTTLLLQLTPGMLLVWVGAWLPRDLGLATNRIQSFVSTNSFEFQALMVVAFTIYSLCVRLIQRQAPQANNRRILRVIWLGMFGAGIIFILMPAMLSHDIFVYAGYGRLLAFYHTNPYFTPFSAYPHDPLYRSDDWRTAVAAYGPLWLGVCGLASLVLGANPLGYILAFRIFGFACHLFNTLLITAILRTTGRTPRTVALGTALYALNPLVLLESALGAHNDVFMVTLLLLGFLFCVRAEQHGITRPRNYLPPVLFFTLAGLIKFTCLPIIALFIIMLFYRTLRSAQTGEASHRPYAEPRPVSATTRQATVLRWWPALLTTLIAGAFSGGVALAGYAPFWVGYSVSQIIGSFSAPPSAYMTAFSILKGITVWGIAHPQPVHSWGYTLLSMFSQHALWNYINIGTVCIGMIIGAICLWRRPTIRTLALVALAILGALLIVTTWFFPWYVTWLMCLAAICLPGTSTRIGRGLLAFTLVFSVSAFSVYLFNGRAPQGNWNGFVCLTSIGPPVLAFLLAITWRRRKPTQQPGGQLYSMTTIGEDSKTITLL
ncbi:MAG: hypothetical protein M3Y81_04410 [Chloroflexota bacterium]|nr:hypothetical protein [Chloroflexota bacterium]